jgi:hypothetical protein
MPATDLGLAHEVASRLRAAVSEASLAARSPEPIEVSMGLSTWPSGQDWQVAYEDVDGELYEDKPRRKAQRSEAPERPVVPIRMFGGLEGDGWRAHRNRLLDQCQLPCFDDRFELGVNPKLAAKAPDVRADGGVADPKLGPDVAARPSRAG